MGISALGGKNTLDKKIHPKFQEELRKPLAQRHWKILRYLKDTAGNPVH